jgi:putative NADPH-quinone reductase
MAKRILLIEGHPDPDPARYLRALADTYAEGAQEAGHEVARIVVGTLEIPFLRSQAEWQAAEPPATLRTCQEAIRRAEHIVILYPLWLGTLPAMLKAFLEQVLRPGFAIGSAGRLGHVPLLKGRSVRIVITMGMPALVYRWWFGAHSLRSLERNVLRFVGLGPIRETLIGPVEAMGPARRAAWIETLRQIGRQGR